MAVIRRRKLPTSNDYKREMDGEKEIKKDPREAFKELLDEGQKITEMEKEKYNQQAEECELIEEGKEELMMSNNQDIMQEYDLGNFKASTSKIISKTSTEAGVASIIKSPKCKRITFAKDLMSELNNPKTISISFSDDSLAVAERLPNNDNLLRLKSSGNKGVIYSSGLVSEITDKYGLDFSNRVSITFSEVNYVKCNGYTVAIIKMKNI